MLAMTPGIEYALGAMLFFGLGDLIYKRGAAAGAQPHHFLMVQSWVFAPSVVLYAVLAFATAISYVIVRDPSIRAAAQTVPVTSMTTKVIRTSRSRAHARPASTARCARARKLWFSGGTVLLLLGQDGRAAANASIASAPSRIPNSVS